MTRGANTQWLVAVVQGPCARTLPAVDMHHARALSCWTHRMPSDLAPSIPYVTHPPPSPKKQLKPPHVVVVVFRSTKQSQ